MSSLPVCCTAVSEEKGLGEGFLWVANSGAASLGLILFPLTPSL